MIQTNLSSPNLPFEPSSGSDRDSDTDRTKIEIPVLTPETIQQLKERYAGGLPLFRTGDPYLIGPDGRKVRNTADNVILGLPFPIVYRGLTAKQAIEVYESIDPNEYGPNDQLELQRAYTEAFALAGVVWPENFGELLVLLEDQIGFGVLDQIASKVRVQSGEVVNPLLVEDIALQPEGWPPPTPEQVRELQARHPGLMLFRWSYRGYHFIYTSMSRRSFERLSPVVQGELQFMLERRMAPSRASMLEFVAGHVLYPDPIDWDQMPYGYLYQVCLAIYRASGFQVEELNVVTDLEL